MTNTNNILEAMRTLRAQKKGGMSHQIFVGILMVLFFVLLLIALALGVSVYQRVADIQIATGEDRLGLQLIANYVRANDGKDAIEVRPGPEGDALVLVERLDTGQYETRIYLHDGSIVEEYAVAETPITPEKAEQLVDSSLFSFKLDGNLLAITTDQGTAKVALRASKGGS